MRIAPPGGVARVGRTLSLRRSKGRVYDAPTLRPGPVPEVLSPAVSMTASRMHPVGRSTAGRTVTAEWRTGMLGERGETGRRRVTMLRASGNSVKRARARSVAGGLDLVPDLAARQLDRVHVHVRVSGAQRR